MNRHRKSQPHRHAAGIGLHRVPDEIADLSELFNGSVSRVDLFCGKPQNGGVKVHIVAA